MRNIVHVVGDTSTLTLTTTNLSNPNAPLEFLSGSFRSSPEERRVASVFLLAEGGSKIFELRLEWTDPLFIEHSVTGRPVYTDSARAVEARPFDQGVS